MRFYASQRLELRALSRKDEERRTTKIKVVKNKLASPFRECEVDIVYGKGFDRLKDTVLFAKELGIIQGKSWMTLPKLPYDGLVYPEGDLKFQGLEAVMDYVRKLPAYLNALMDECQKTYTGGAAAEPAEPEPNEAEHETETEGREAEPFDENGLLDAES
jgi:hypothetical protein